VSSSEESTDDTSQTTRTRSWLRTAVIGVVGVFVLLVGLAVAGTGDIIDLPAWANIDGVDVPLVGDTDAIDCRLRQIDGSTRVEITIVDGDESTYDQYVHVWNNGGIVDPSEIERPALDTIISSSREGFEEQFYSISIVPVEEGRVFCESLILEG